MSGKWIHLQPRRGKTQIPSILLKRLKLAEIVRPNSFQREQLTRDSDCHSNHSSEPANMERKVISRR